MRRPVAAWIVGVAHEHVGKGVDVAAGFPHEATELDVLAPVLAVANVRLEIGADLSADAVMEVRHGQRLEHRAVDAQKARGHHRALDKSVAVRPHFFAQRRNGPFARFHLLWIDSRNDGPRRLTEANETIRLETDIGVDEDEVVSIAVEEISDQNAASPVDVRAGQCVEVLNLDPRVHDGLAAPHDGVFGVSRKIRVGRHGDTHAPGRRYTVPH